LVSRFNAKTVKSVSGVVLRRIIAVNYFVEHHLFF